MMNKVKFFSAFDLDYNYKARNNLEEEINRFGMAHEILHVSICTEQHGRSSYSYIAAVTYKGD